MPIYEYICSSCGETFSVLQRMSATEGETECPKCGKKDAKRKISSFSCGAGGGFGSTGGFSGG